MLCSSLHHSALERKGSDYFSLITWSWRKHMSSKPCNHHEVPGNAPQDDCSITCTRVWEGSKCTREKQIIDPLLLGRLSPSYEWVYRTCTNLIASVQSWNFLLNCNLFDLVISNVIPYVPFSHSLIGEFNTTAEELASWPNGPREFPVSQSSGKDLLKAFCYFEELFYFQLIHPEKSRKKKKYTNSGTVRIFPMVCVCVRHTSSLMYLPFLLFRFICSLLKRLKLLRFWILSKEGEFLILHRFLWGVVGCHKPTALTLASFVHNNLTLGLIGAFMFACKVAILS